MVELTPERAIEVQIAARLRHRHAARRMRAACRPSAAEIERAMQLSLRWAERCKRAFEGRAARSGAVRHRAGRRRPASARGERARRWSTSASTAMRSAGLPSARPQDVMLKIVGETTPALPADQPRYLMGVGTPDDILEAVARGIDMFDCVMPTRNGRHGLAFHALRPDQYQECAARRRSAAARCRKPLPGRARLFARLPASPVQGRRSARRHASLDRQSLLLPGPDGGRARGHRGGTICRLCGADQGTMGRKARFGSLIGPLSGARRI